MKTLAVGADLIEILPLARLLRLRCASAVCAKVSRAQTVTMAVVFFKPIGHSSLVGLDDSIFDAEHLIAIHEVMTVYGAAVFQLPCTCLIKRKTGVHVFLRAVAR
jgi:hypothetical protein